MKVDEPVAALRRMFLTIYTADGSALATDADVSPPAGAIQISQNGASFVNGGGTLVHVGGGSYYYEATLGETHVPGFLAFKYQRVGYKTELDWINVGPIFSLGETDTTRLRLPFTVFNANSPPDLATGATIASPGDLQISVNGSAYVNVTGTMVSVQSSAVDTGLYYYQGVASNASVLGSIMLKYVSAGFSETVTWLAVEASSGGGAGGLISLSPANGSLLSPDPVVARFTPITATIQCETGHKPYVFAQIGSLRWTIYDGTQDKIADFFGDHTSVSALGGDRYSITVLPNGGWWRSGIDIRFVSGVELT